MFWTRIEFNVLNLMALQYARFGNYDEAIAIFRGLKSNTEKLYKWDSIENGKRYPAVVFNLVNTLCDLDPRPTSEIIDLCDKGHKVCVNTGPFRLLPDILFIKAYALVESGDKEAGESVLKDVYYLFKTLEAEEGMQATKDYALEKGIVSLIGL